MSAERRIRDLIAVGVALVLALLALRQSARHPGEVSGLDRGLLAILSPAQGVLSGALRGLGGFAGRYVDLLDVRSENEELRRENNRLKAQLLEARRHADDSSRYQKLLGLRDETPADAVAARVIAIDASPYFRVARVSLDRGEGTVRRGMPVMTPDGVVGRINRVAANTSDILLAVDPRSAIEVVIPRTGGRGLLRGKAGENGYRCSIEYLMRGETVKAGDEVTTSGLGGGFPKDIPVGRVSKVGATVGLYQDVEVTPHVNFARLSEVLVVVAPEPASDREAGKRAPPPSGGLAGYR